MQTLTGIVQYFNEAEGCGWVRFAQASGEDSRFCLDQIRTVQPGEEWPHFLAESPRSFEIPLQGSRITCQVEKVPYRIVRNPRVGRCQPIYRVIAWNFQFFWERAGQKVASRKAAEAAKAKALEEKKLQALAALTRFQVTRKIFVNGHRATGDADEVVFAGTLDEYRAAHPKGLPGAMLPLENVYTWQTRVNGNPWTPCADPTNPVRIAVQENASAGPVAVPVVRKEVQKKKPVAMPKQAKRPLSTKVDLGQLTILPNPATLVDQNAVAV